MKRIALIAAAAVSLAVAAPAQASTVSLLLSRGAIQPATSKCKTIAGGVSVWQVAADLKARGASAGEIITPSATAQADGCGTAETTLGWQSLRQLRDQYGWSAYPRGSGDDGALSTQLQLADSCGLLPTFTAQGFPGANLFYSPSGNQTSASLEQVVSGCYTLTRRYSKQPNPDPTWLNVISLNGGQKNYQTPAAVIAKIKVAQPSAVLQAYRFVSGSRATGSGVHWDCTAAKHWTSQDEVYCYSDYLAILDGSGATFTTVG